MPSLPPIRQRSLAAFVVPSQAISKATSPHYTSPRVEIQPEVAELSCRLTRVGDGRHKPRESKLILKIQKEGEKKLAKDDPQALSLGPRAYDVFG